MFWTVIIGVVFIIVGVFAFLKPELVWEWTERWKSYYADGPSDLYVFNTKIGAVMFVLVGIAAVILPFVLE